MDRTRLLLPVWMLGLGLLWAACACDGDDSHDSSAATAAADSQSDAADTDPEAAARAAEQARLGAEYPLYGVVLATELRIYVKPSAESTVVGWARVGNTLRLKKTQKAGPRGDEPTCDGRFRAVHPFGFICEGEGLALFDKPPELEQPTDDGWKEGQVEAAQARGALVAPPPARDEPLPYDYYFVKEPAVPEYHRLPSRNEQRAALAKAARYLELLEEDEKRAKAYLAGERDDGPPGTAVTARYLDRGFFVAASGSEVRAFRRFVRTTGGRFIKQAQLEARQGHDFQGIELDEQHTLPVAWATRTARPMKNTAGPDAEPAFEDDPELAPIERQTLLRWRERKNLGGRVMHVIDTERGERYLRSWFAAVAERIDRPEGVSADETWVHIDLSEQTLVLYEGDSPRYATLVSSGVSEHETPTGLFEIERKRTTDTMADLGPDAGDDRYRIEDVPYTQYFDGSVALHAAFWHTRFGLPRSHGCVNLSPPDAHRIFKATAPALPPGWHGVSTVDTPLHGSHVWVTD